MSQVSRPLALALAVSLSLAARAQGDGRAVELDEAVLAQALLAPRAQAAPSSALARRAPLAVALPEPDGATADYVLEPTRVLSPGLQAAYPHVRTFRGFRQNPPHRPVRATYAPATGWRLSYGGPGQARAVVRADAPGDYRLHRADEAPGPDLSCVTEGAPPASAPPAALPLSSSSPSDATPLRTYRLALSCTGEYARAVGGADATVEDVIAEFASGVNRLNEVFERDLAISLVLADGTDALVYLDPRTDPYSDGDAGAMIDEAQGNIPAVIGADAYDVGHLYGTGGSGLAALGAVCADGEKASGITGVANPTGDFFYIDYVAHELGHQFGATHTFYNSCGRNRSDVTAFEPGSGSTIMAYAGICQPNVQQRSDDYFHAGSLAQVRGFVAAAGCGTKEEGLNAAPVFDDAPAALTTYYVPAGSAFELRAPATDPDGDDLSYAFEQMDAAGAAAQPPRGRNTEGPLFRSEAPSPRPYRRFGDGDGDLYDVRPTVAREINVRATARDMRRPAGQTAARDFRVVVADAAPLVLAVADTALGGFSTYELTWAVGGSTAAPVSAAAVDLLFSPDGGATWTDTLALAAPNVGSSLVTVPNVATGDGRFVARDPGGAFYDVGRGAVTVTPTEAPTFTLTAAAATVEACSEQFFALVDVSTAPQLGFGEEVTLGLEGLPDVLAATSTISGDGGRMRGLFEIVAVAEAVPPGQYPVTLVASGGGVERRLTVVIDVAAAPVATVAEASDVDGARLTATTVELAFSEAAEATGYRLQVARDGDFGDPVLDERAPYLDPVAGRNRRVLTDLEPGVYAYRAAYLNRCGEGPWGAYGSFQVIELRAEEFTSASPVPIGDGPGGTYTSTIEVDRAGPLLAVEVDVDVEHSWIGDLSAAVTPPGTGARDLFDEPSGGDCSGSDLAVTFAADATASPRDFVNTCGAGVPSVSGRFRPVQALPAGVLAAPAGTWTLTLRDDAADDGGELRTWGLRLLSAGQTPPDVSFAPEVVDVPADVLEVSLDLSDLGLDNPEGVSLDAITVALKPGRLSLPAGPGGLYRDGERLPAGARLSLAEVTSEIAVRHSHPDSVGATDVFVFDVLGPRGLYLPNVQLTARVDVAVSTVEAGRQLSLKLYPNPAHDVVSVALGGAEAIRRVRLFDVTGRAVRVLAQAPQTSAVAVDVSDLAAGYYVVDVEGDSGRGRVGLVVE